MQSPGQLILLVYSVLVGLLILLGNALVILAFWRGPRHIRTYTNYFVVNLGVSDILVGCFSVPFWICLQLELISESHPNYKYFISIDVLCGATSILCLTAISLERTFAVKYPVLHYNLSHRYVLAAIAATWAIGISLAAAKLTFGDRNHLSPYTLIVLCLSFILPLIIIIASYVVIFVTANRVSKTANLRQEMRVAKTISVIIGLFVVCWTPFFVMNVLYFACEPQFCAALDKQSWLVYLAKALHIGNSMMNFFVYAVRSRDFRGTFRALVFNKCNTEALRRKVRSFSQKTSLLKPRFNSVNSPTTNNLQDPDAKENGAHRSDNNKTNETSTDIICIGEMLT